MSSLKVYDLNELFFPLVLHMLTQSQSPYPLISVSTGTLSDQAVLWNEPLWGYLHFLKMLDNFREYSLAQFVGLAFEALTIPRKMAISLALCG